jgi:hypothetical protein
MRAANYVEETTTSIAGTSGNGAVTLTSITNTPRFSTAFGTQATVIKYIIEDTVNKKFETGIGSIASNVLTRTKVQATWDGATYTVASPTALQFGSTPTSGDIKIRMGATAESIPGVIDITQSTVAGDASWRDYPFSGAYHITNGTGSSATLTAGTEYYSYYELKASGNLKGVQFEVKTLVAASNMKLALYCVGSDGLPGAKIVDFVTTSTASTGVKTDTATGSWSPTTAILLNPGWYVIGYISDGAIALSSIGTGSNMQRQTPLGRKNSYGNSGGLSIAGNYTTGLPAVANVGGGTMLDPAGTGLSGTWFGLKVQ